MPSKSSLDLRQQVGQLLIMGFEGTSVSAHLRSMLGTLHPSGVILFKRNITEAAQTYALLREAQKIVATPMFRCVDMEGGTVDRFRDVIAPIPSAADVAATGSLKLFRKHGKLIGQQLRALGFNTDFAPCVDLRFRESKTALGSRTISLDPERQSAMPARSWADSRCRNPRLWQALSWTRRSQHRQPSRSPVYRQDLEPTLERRPRPIS